MTRTSPEPQAYNPTPTLVKGRTYCATMFNGAEFTFWVPRRLNRSEAQNAAVDFANGTYPWDFTDLGPAPYGQEDVESCQLAKGVLT